MNKNKILTKDVVLRPYQKECIDIVDKKPEGKHLIALATGLGKTVIFSRFKRYGRVLILSHRDELVNQPEKYFDCSFGVEKAGKHSDGEDVVSASVQTLSHESRLKQYKPDDFHTIIIDEAHHAAAPSYKKILNYFSGAKRVIGVTATPKRGDGVRLDDVFEDIIYAKDLRWGIENKYLSPVHCRQVKAKYSLKGVKKSMGDFNLADIDSKITPDAIGSVAKVLCDCLKEDRHVLVYCTTVKICEFLKSVVDAMLPEEERDKVAVLSGKTAEDDRSSMLDGFMKGNVRAIINCMVLTEGTDLPLTDTIINFRPTCNASLYQQIVGRGTRLYEGKENCLSIDILPDDDSGSRTLCTTLTLFGIDANFLDAKKKEKLEDHEEVDPLEISNELLGRFTEFTKAYEYRLEQVNRFISEHEYMVESALAHPKASLKDLAMEYSKYTKKQLDSIQNDYDFLGMSFSLMPDIEHRYCIKPTWNDVIYIAEPNVMDNTTITFVITEKNKKERYYISDMKMNDAIAFAHDYCMISPEYMRYSWDSKMQETWEAANATENQIAKLHSEYDGFKDGRINKLQASGLIDLATRIDKIKKEEKEMHITKGMHQSTIDKKQETFKKKMNEDLNAKEAGRAAFDAFKKTVDLLVIKKKKEDQKKMEEFSGVTSDFLNTDHVVVNASVYSHLKPASDRQIKFLSQIRAEQKANGIIIDDKVKYKNMKTDEASICISILLYMQNHNIQPKIYNKVVFIPKSSIDQAVRFSNSVADKEIVCDIKYEVKEGK